jgi:hypothetical protein
MKIDPNFSLVTGFVVSCMFQLAKSERKQVAKLHAAMMEDAAIAKTQAIKLLQGRVSILTQPRINPRNFL